MNMSKNARENQHTSVKGGAFRLGFKLFWSGLAIAVAIAILGAATDSPAIVVGVVGGSAVCVFAFVIVFKAKAALKRDLENHSNSKRSNK